MERAEIRRILGHHIHLEEACPSFLGALTRRRGPRWGWRGRWLRRRRGRRGRRGCRSRRLRHRDGAEHHLDGRRSGDRQQLPSRSDIRRAQPPHTTRRVGQQHVHRRIGPGAQPRARVGGLGHCEQFARQGPAARLRMDVEPLTPAGRRLHRAIRRDERILPQPLIEPAVAPSREHQWRAAPRRANEREATGERRVVRMIEWLPATGTLFRSGSPPEIAIRAEHRDRQPTGECRRRDIRLDEYALWRAKVGPLHAKRARTGARLIEMPIQPGDVGVAHPARQDDRRHLLPGSELHSSGGAKAARACLRRYRRGLRGVVGGGEAVVGRPGEIGQRAVGGDDGGRRQRRQRARAIPRRLRSGRRAGLHGLLRGGGGELAGTARRVQPTVRRPRHAHRRPPAIGRQPCLVRDRAAKNPRVADMLQREAVARMILIAPFNILLGGNDLAVLHGRDYADVPAVCTVRACRPWLPMRVDLAPHQDVAGDRCMIRAIGVHHEVVGMIARQPEVRRIAPAGSPPAARRVTERPGGESYHQLHALERQPIAVARRATRRAARLIPVRGNAVTTDVGAIGSAAVDAVGADVHPEPATSLAVARKDRAPPLIAVGTTGVVLRQGATRGVRRQAVGWRGECGGRRNDSHHRDQQQQHAEHGTR